MTLRDCTADELRLMALLSDPEADANELQDTIEMVEANFNDKVESYCFVQKQMHDDADTLKAEAKRLSERAKALEKGADRMNEWLKTCLLATGQRKLNTLHYTLSVRKSTSAEVDDMSKVPQECLTFAEPKANRTAIKEWIKTNGPCDWAHLEDHENLTIK